jgi:hypothetical protein
MIIYRLRIICILIILTENLLFAPAQGLPKIPDEKCMVCHGKSDFKIKMVNGFDKQLSVNDSLLKLSSAHGNISCNDCHIDITELTPDGHKADVKQVQCTRCHFDSNFVNATDTKKVNAFNENVHSKARLTGNREIPNCQSCHGSHDIQKRSSLSILELKRKIGQMCGKCHFEVFAVYSASIHGKALFEKNIYDVPSCTDCHGEHMIRKSDNINSSTYKTNIYKTCGTCHADEKIVGKYGVSVDKYQTYENSFHGIYGNLGDKSVANCASCHGAHDIKSQNDPTSSINPNNLVRTCGRCHPDANINYVKGKMHVNENSQQAGFSYYINSIFKWLIAATFMLLVLHVIMSQYRRLRKKRI